MTGLARPTLGGQKQHDSTGSEWTCGVLLCSPRVVTFEETRRSCRRRHHYRGALPQRRQQQRLTYKANSGLIGDRGKVDVSEPGTAATTECCANQGHQTSVGRPFASQKPLIIYLARSTLHSALTGWLGFISVAVDKQLRVGWMCLTNSGDKKIKLIRDVMKANSISAGSLCVYFLLL